MIMEHAFTGRMTVVGLATGGVVGLATVTPASGFIGPMPCSRRRRCRGNYLLPGNEGGGEGAPIRRLI